MGSEYIAMGTREYWLLHKPDVLFKSLDALALGGDEFDQFRVQLIGYRPLIPLGGLRESLHPIREAKRHHESFSLGPAPFTGRMALQSESQFLPCSSGAGSPIPWRMPIFQVHVSY